MLARIRTWQKDLGHFQNRRILSIFILGIAQGFPWLIIGSSLTLWLQESGISRSTIGYAGAIFGAYSINFLWSPLIDRFNWGFLGRTLGGRKAWIFLTQALIALACMAISFFSPTENLHLLMTVAIFIAFSAATQDIAIDALRIDSFPPEDTKSLSAAAAVATAGWWTGYSGLGFFPLWLSDQPNWDWPNIYPILGAGMLVIMMLALWLAQEPSSNRKPDQLRLHNRYSRLIAHQPREKNLLILILMASIPSLILWGFLGSPGMASTISNNAFYFVGLIIFGFFLAGLLLRILWQINGAAEQFTTTATISRGNQILAWLIVLLVEPLRSFFKNNGLRWALGILAFIFLFKIGEAFLGRMSVVFYKEVGFTNTDIATLSKLLNWGVTIVFSLLGGLVNIHWGIVRGLLISGIAMAATNLLFSVLVVIGPVKWFLAFSVIVDGFAQAWSLVALVSLISFLCDRTFSASQYALMASLSTLGRTLISSTSGQVVDWLDGNWTVFFILTAVMVIPSLLVLVQLKDYINRLSGHTKKP